MPAASALSIADSVPVTRTYTPQRVDAGQATLVDKATYTFIGGQSTLILSFDPSSSKRTTDRIGVRLNLPKVANISGVDTVDSIGRFIGEFIIPESWTTLDRNNIATLVANSFANSVVKGITKDRDPMW